MCSIHLFADDPKSKPVSIFGIKEALTSPLSFKSVKTSSPPTDRLPVKFESPDMSNLPKDEVRTSYIS